jgi:hypothetical protein
MFTSYTPQTADKALPKVKRLFENIIMQKDHVVALQEETQVILLKVLLTKNKSLTALSPTCIVQ